jgi:hypothetical protein
MALFAAIFNKATNSQTNPTTGFAGRAQLAPVGQHGRAPGWPDLLVRQE